LDSAGSAAIPSRTPRSVPSCGNQTDARTMMMLTLSADHRPVDGAVAAEFLRTLKGLLEEPGLMLV
jgi:pyruvate dehydrogenase E2 component (dihydrolipoamide acetyltransferase)